LPPLYNVEELENPMKAPARTAIFLLSALLLCLPQAFAQSPLTLTLGHGNAPNNPKSKAAEQFAELVKEKSGGKIAVAIEGGAKLGDDLAMIISVSTGKLDLSINSQGAASSLVPDLSAIGLPYAFASSAKAWEVLDGPIGQDLAKKLEAKGVIVIGWMDNGIRQITNSKHPVVKPEDMIGLRIRTTTDKSIMDTMTVLGASPVPMNFSTVYDALKQKFVDGQDNPLANIHSAKLHEVQQYISITNHNYSVAPFVMSRQAWEKLSSDQRGWIKAAAQDATAAQRKAMADSDVLLLAEYEKMPSVKVNKADQAAFKAAVKKVWDNWELKPFGAFVKKLRAVSN
jgi:tripartite ATP-independent transporter DctP family solute receptor